MAGENKRRMKVLGVLVVVSLLTSGQATVNHWPGKHLNKGGNFQYQDCDQVRKAGYNDSGIYLVWYNSTTPYKVVCNHTEAGSSTVIQRRVYGNVNFEQPWRNYVAGFGDARGDYWAGLNSIYYLTTTGNTVMTVNMQDFYGNSRQIRYSFFKVASNSELYRLSIADAYGNVPDDLSFNNNGQFATYDMPDQHQCAMHMRAGWWYNYCSLALPNGHYYRTSPYTPPGGFYDGIYWKDWQGYGYSLKFISMTLSNR